MLEKDKKLLFNQKVELSEASQSFRAQNTTQSDFYGGALFENNNKYKRLNRNKSEQIFKETKNESFMKQDGDKQR